MQPINGVIAFLWSPDCVAAVQGFFGPGWLPFFLGLTQLGTLQFALAATALLLWFRGKEAAYLTLGTAAIALASALLLKQLLFVPRPHGPEVIAYVRLHDSSFPSGHAATAAALWGALALWVGFPLLMAAGVTLGVLLSRLYLGVHYLGDVLVGALLALALLTAVHRMYPWLRPALTNRPAWQYGLLLAIGSVIWGVLVAPRTGEWDIMAGMVGLAVAVPLEARCVRYAPLRLSWRWQLLKAALGLGVLAVLVGVGAFLGGANTPLSFGAYWASALWVIVLAPALFRRLEAGAQ